MQHGTTTAALTGLILASALGAQQTADSSLTTSRPSHPQPGSYYPLAEDASWRYRDTGGAEGKPVECEYRCLGRVDVKGSTCHELSFRRGKYRSWEYWADRKGGLFRFHRGYLGGWRGVNRNRKPQRLLAQPVGATLSWKWTEMGSVQTMAGAPQPDPETLKIHYTAQIEEVQDKVKVPAGEFTAVRVRIKTKGFYSSDVTWWFAKGVGPVKRLTKGHGENKDRVLELTKFTPGVDIKESPLTTAKRRIKKDKRSQDPGIVDLHLIKQKVVGDNFRSKFYEVWWNKTDKPSFVRVRLGKAYAFDPASIDDWRQLAKDEGLEMSDNPMGHDNADQAATHFGQALALFVGKLQGKRFKPYTRISDFVTEVAFKDKTITVKGSVRSGAGDKTPPVPVLIRFDKKGVRDVQSPGIGKPIKDEKPKGGGIKIERFGGGRDG